MLVVSLFGHIIEPTLIHCDSKSCMILSLNSVSHDNSDCSRYLVIIPDTRTLNSLKDHFPWNERSEVVLLYLSHFPWYGCSILLCMSSIFPVCKQ
jgi:hypothetical protein